MVALKRNWPLILLIAILVIATGFRLYRVRDYLVFLGDEGRDALVWKRMIVDHKFTLLGPTASVGGFYLGPIYYYLTLPFVWIWGLDPVGPVYFVAILGIATVYLVYLFSFAQPKNKIDQTNQLTVLIGQSRNPAIIPIKTAAPTHTCC